MSLLITWRIRQVPPSGANVSPVRFTRWISEASPTVKASTRKLGRLTDTRPHAASPPFMTSATTRSIPEKSALESDVRATSS